MPSPETPSPAEFAQGTFALDRYPPDKRNQLRAWDAADDYVLAELADELAEAGIDTTTVAPHIVLINDTFGALATAVASWFPSSRITSVSDSILSEIGARKNLETNGIDVARVTQVSACAEVTEDANLMIVRIPKSGDLLEHQLRTIRPRLNSQSRVVGAAMTRNIHTSTIEHFESILGPTTTTLAKRKARLINTTIDDDKPQTSSPWPISYATTLSGTPPLEIVSEAGVFAAGRLDQGTSLFLNSLPHEFGAAEVIDLGCGDGVVGMVAATRIKHGAVTFVDESYGAVRSAQLTWEANHAKTTGEVVPHFVVANVLDSPELQVEGTIDYVLCNPPFHADHAITDAVAWDMFSQSHSALHSGGELWVVGNRHLHYHAKLKRQFGNSEVVASNTKFVVLRAVR